MPIRSDVPLWGDYQDQSVWPHSFEDGEDFGCVSIIDGRYGRWLLDGDATAPALEMPDDWIDFTNPGIFHCSLSMSIRSAEAPDAPTTPETAFLIELGEVSKTDPRRLFALQIGMLGGSEYWLMSAPAGPNRVGQSYDILDVQCPSRRIERRARFNTVFRTTYCAVNDRDALIAAARKALARPPVARLAFASPPSRL